MEIESPLNKLLDLISDDKISEIEAERLLNAAARLSSSVPTGIAQSPKQTHSHS